MSVEWVPHESMHKSLKKGFAQVSFDVNHSLNRLLEICIGFPHNRHQQQGSTFEHQLKDNVVCFVVGCGFWAEVRAARGGPLDCDLQPSAFPARGAGPRTYIEGEGKL